jgi:hypothetical protein
MKLSLSVRVGEKYTNKREAAISLDELANIAVATGYHAICMAFAPTKPQHAHALLRSSPPSTSPTPMPFVSKLWISFAFECG